MVISTSEIVIGVLLLGSLSVMVILIVFVGIPYAVQCPRCRFRIASVKVSSTSSLSSQEYQLAGGDRRYGGEHICSTCWGDLNKLGFFTTGNWAPGATIEYLKTTPNFIAVLISVGALVVSIVAILRQPTLSGCLSSLVRP